MAQGSKGPGVAGSKPKLPLDNTAQIIAVDHAPHPPLEPPPHPRNTTPPSHGNFLARLWDYWDTSRTRSEGSDVRGLLHRPRQETQSLVEDRWSIYAPDRANRLGNQQRRLRPHGHGI
jgi:hypothetical protein